MGSIGEYILSVIGGCLICSVILALASKTKYESLITLLCGLFMTVSMLYPLIHMNIDTDITDHFHNQLQDGKTMVAVGENYSRDLMKQCIRTSAEEYILDKATAMGISLEVTVTVSDADIPVPVAVKLSGNCHSEEQKQLEEMISQDLNISKEHQQWKEANSDKE